MVDESNPEKGEIEGEGKSVKVRVQNAKTDVDVDRPDGDDEVSMKTKLMVGITTSGRKLITRKLTN